MLGRPHTVAPLVESIVATTPDPHIIFGCTVGDVEVIKEVEGFDHFEVGGPMPGDYARKINMGYQLTDEPLLFTGACDIRFLPGWFEAATARLDGTVGVVGTNDLGSRRVMAGDHATHSLVTRDYVDRFGTIDEPGVVLHEGYHHEFVDDEFVQTAMHRGMWAFAEDSHVEHLHPNWNKAPSDRMYRMQGRRMRLGKRVYAERKHLWT
jgi:hypothetical protein